MVHIFRFYSQKKKYIFFYNKDYIIIFKKKQKKNQLNSFYTNCFMSIIKSNFLYLYIL